MSLARERYGVLAVLLGLLLCLTPASSIAAETGDPAATDPVDSRGTAAAAALMSQYDQDTGLFEDGWWTSANALTAIIDNLRDTGDRRYEYAISRTHDLNIDARQGDFTNDYLDDTGWWGLAWVAAYDVTGERRYLDTARADAEHMFDNWTDQCGGGVMWNRKKDYKNAITNELFLQLNAALHNRVPDDTTYLNRALGEWDWFRDSGMINPSHMVNDGLDDDCGNNGQTTWTYNQGVILGGLTELYRATGDEGLLDTARSLADASTTSADLHADGILREPGETDRCTGDDPSFKGAYVRGLGALDEQLSDHPYGRYLDRQADAAYTADRDERNMYGPHWNGPWVASGHRCQHSAVDLLNAAPGS